MLSEILAALILGVIAGTITGLTPGVHVNLISIILVSLSSILLESISPLTICAFIISMCVVHTFIDSIPSIFLGAPDSDQVLSALPGHKLLLEGKGYEAVKLTVIGSLVCLIITIVLVPILIPVLGFIDSFLKPFIGFILVEIVLYMILKEKSFSKKVWSALIFFFSGIFGIIVLNFPNLNQPLFPMLSGLFGTSMLLISLSSKVNVPEQKISESISMSKGNLAKIFAAGTFSGCLTGIFPGLGAAQAAILAAPLAGDIGDHGYMVLVGGINTVNFAFSLATLYALGKARNGAVLAVMQILDNISWANIAVFLSVALVAGGIATFLALGITRVFAKVITKVNYPMLCVCIILFVTGLVFYFSGIIGLLVLVIGTAIGILPSYKGVGKNMAMGCIMLPVMLYFLMG